MTIFAMRTHRGRGRVSESMAGGESSRMWASGVEPAVHSEGRREVTIGVVGTAAANRRIFRVAERMDGSVRLSGADRKSTRLNSSHVAIAYAVFGLNNRSHR